MSATNPYEMFEIDTQAENEEGIIVEYPVKGHDNRSFRVRFVHSGDSNVHFRDALRARLKPLSFRIQQEMVTDEEYEDILIAVFADKIIKSWESKDENGNYVSGLYSDDFAIIPADKASIANLFKKARRLFRDIKKQSDNFATFRNSFVEEAIKN